jgi:hypothetical protein
MTKDGSIMRITRTRYVNRVVVIYCVAHPIAVFESCLLCCRHPPGDSTAYYIPKSALHILAFAFSSADVYRRYVR